MGICRKMADVSSGARLDGSYLKVALNGMGRAIVSKEYARSRLRPS